MSEKIDPSLLAEAIWANYYTLSSTPSEAMEALWSEYPSMVTWVNEDYGVSESELLKIISMITLMLVDTDTTKTAIEAWKVPVQ